MRKLLMVTVLIGATAAVSGARAAPHFASPVPLASGAPAAELVHWYSAQYDEDWRHREWRRREEFERWRRHREWRRERYEERERDHRGW